MLSTVLLYRATSDSRAVIAVTEPGAVAVAVVTRGGYSTIPIVHVAFSVSSDPVRSASESIYIRIHVYRYIYIYPGTSRFLHTLIPPRLPSWVVLLLSLLVFQGPSLHSVRRSTSRRIHLVSHCYFIPPPPPHQRTRRKNIHTLQTCTQQDSRHRREWPSPIFLWP